MNQELHIRWSKEGERRGKEKIYGRGKIKSDNLHQWIVSLIFEFNGILQAIRIRK